ncbi:MAG: response regulator [Candidatus Aminicenantales bacterium]
MARILIIDDDDQIRSLLKQMLEKEGHSVQEAGNGKEGLALFKATPADLVIADILMPEKEGIETIRELLEDYPGTKIIAVSGGGVVPAELCLNLSAKLGASQTIRKPFTKSEFLKTVRQTLDGGHRRP